MITIDRGTGAVDELRAEDALAETNPAGTLPSHWGHATSHQRRALKRLAARALDVAGPEGEVTYWRERWSDRGIVYVGVTVRVGPATGRMWQRTAHLWVQIGKRGAVKITTRGADRIARSNPIQYGWQHI